MKLTNYISIVMYIIPVTKTLSLIIFLALCVPVNSQQLKSRTFTTKSVTPLDVNKVYHKQTGEKIKANVVRKMIKNDPNLNLMRIYDEYGKVEKYLYDPNPRTNKLQISGNAPLKIGELFPRFVVETVNDETIDLNNLKGKIIFLRFELFADNFRFKKDEIRELDQKINAFDNKSEIEALIIFTTPKEEVLRGFDIQNSNFKLVPNGKGFHSKFHIASYPSTLVIDKQGRLIGNYTRSELINIEKLLMKH